MNKPTLDEFITRGVNNKFRFPINNWVLEPKFESLYVRYGTKCIDWKFYEGVLDIANVTVEPELQGTGVFTALITRLRKTYPELHIYVEIAQQKRFQDFLVKVGFTAVNDNSFFLLATAIFDPTRQLQER